MNTRGYFIAGTDTGVGKTRVTTGLITAFRGLGVRVSGMKPVAAGGIVVNDRIFNEDVLSIAEVSGQLPADVALNPYCLSEAVSPNIGAKHAGISIELGVISSYFRQLSGSSDLVIVEGAGGWLTPISEQRTMADVAAVLGLPVVLTVALRLGCLNHALLTAEAINQKGLSLAGWVGNQTNPDFQALAENLETLSVRLGSVPLALLPFSPDPRSAWPPLREAAATLLTRQRQSES
jgi:dethiobiotin synthetase